MRESNVDQHAMERSVLGALLTDRMRSEVMRQTSGSGPVMSTGAC